MLVASILVLGMGARLVSVESFAAELSREMKVPISVGAPLRRDLVYVEPRGASPKVQLSLLGSALNASISPFSGGFQIDRTGADLNRIEKELTQQNAEWIARTIHEVSDLRKSDLFSSPDRASAFFRALDREEQRLKELLEGSRVQQDMNSSTGSLPSEELMEDLISKIGFEEVGSIRKGEGRVYEDDPGFDGKPLPAHDDLVARFQSEMEALRSHTLSAAEFAKLKQSHFHKELAGWNGPSQVTKLRLEELGEPTSIWFHLEGFNANGTRTAEAWLTVLQPDYVMFPANVLKAEASKPDTTWLDLSASQSEANSQARFEAGKSIPGWFGKPSSVEPLNLFATAALAALAQENPNAPFIASASDELWTIVADSTLNGRLNLKVMKRLLKVWSGYRRVDTSDGVAWRNDDPEFEEARMVDRNELSRFAQDFVGSHHLSARSAASLHFNGCTEFGSVANAWNAIIILHDGVPQMEVSGGNEVYRLFGSITDQAWDSLQSGRTTTCGDLGIVAEANRFLATNRLLKTEGGKVSDLFLHPGEILKGGVTDSTPCRIEVTKDQMVQIKGGMYPGIGWLPMESMASAFRLPRRAYRSGPNGYELQVTREQYEQDHKDYLVRFGFRPTYTLKIGMPSNLFFSARIEESPTSDSDSILFADLPQSVRDEYWERACNMALKFQKESDEAIARFRDEPAGTFIRQDGDVFPIPAKESKP